MWQLSLLFSEPIVNKIYVLLSTQMSHLLKTSILLHPDICTNKTYTFIPVYLLYIYKNIKDIMITINYLCQCQMVVSGISKILVDSQMNVCYLCQPRASVVVHYGLVVITLVYISRENLSHTSHIGLISYLHLAPTHPFYSRSKSWWLHCELYQ